MNPAKDAGQVIGYSHSTWRPKDDNQAAGYQQNVAATNSVMGRSP